MIISKRHKGKSTCDIKCDKCGEEWRGNYYVMKKRDNHYCLSCASKKGWKDKFDKNPSLIPEELKPFIIKRVDGKSLKHLPQKKDIKIIIKCSKCNYERQSNAFDVLNKKSTLCNSCKQKERWKNKSFKNKQLAKRNSKEYRENMSKSMKKSQAWKDTQHLRIKGLKKYWKKVRGGKELHEVLTEWELYRKTVYKMSEVTYRKYKHIINPDNLKRGRVTYHVDHKYSILEGFKNNIPPYIMSNYKNLQMLTSKENIGKDYRCSISKEKLYKQVVV